MDISIEIIHHYFPHFTATQYELLQQYAGLLAEHNHYVNLISRKDVEHVVVRHLLHSLAIAKFFTFTHQETVLDLGTGGGLPGIPLAIAFPDTQFILTDSIAKKITALQQITTTLLLQNVITRHTRVEEMKDKVDAIVTRAVAPMNTLVHWTAEILKNNLPKNRGIIALKGGNLEQETQMCNPLHITVYDISTCFEEEFFETKKVLLYHHC